PGRVGAGVVDRDDVRVDDARGESRLAEEARPEHVVADEVLGEHLQRDGPTQSRVVREVDGRHAAVTKRALELVALPAGGRGLRHRLRLSRVGTGSKPVKDPRRSRPSPAWGSGTTPPSASCSGRGWVVAGVTAVDSRSAGAVVRAVDRGDP